MPEWVVKVKGTMPISLHSSLSFTFLTQELRDGTIVVRTGKRRDEIDVAVRAPLEKATARNLDHNIKLDRR